MSKSLIVQNSTVEGWVSLSAFSVDRKFRVMPYDTLDFTVNWIRSYASGSGGLDRLLILAHGYEDLVESKKDSQSYSGGGYGIGLGKDGLSRANVHKLSSLKGLVNAIVVYSCAAADTLPGNEETVDDGKMFMSEIALWSGATVFASDRTQLYGRSGSIQKINMGDWEGTVFEFDPKGGYWAVN